MVNESPAEKTPGITFASQEIAKAAELKPQASPESAKPAETKKYYDYILDSLDKEYSAKNPPVSGDKQPIKPVNEVAQVIVAAKIGESRPYTDAELDAEIKKYPNEPVLRMMKEDRDKAKVAAKVVEPKPENKATETPLAKATENETKTKVDDKDNSKATDEAKKKAEEAKATEKTKPTEPKAEVESADAVIARIEKEIADKIAGATDIKGKKLKDGERRAIAKDIYLRELTDYSIQHIKGFRGAFGRAFAFLLGKETVKIVDGNGKTVKEAKVNRRNQNPEQGLVDFLKSEFEKKVKAAKATATTQNETKAPAEPAEKSEMKTPPQSGLSLEEIDEQIQESIKTKGLAGVDAEIAKQHLYLSLLTKTGLDLKAYGEKAKVLIDKKYPGKLSEAQEVEKLKYAGELLREELKNQLKVNSGIPDAKASAGEKGNSAGIIGSAKVGFKEGVKEALAQANAKVSTEKPKPQEVKIGSALWKNKSGDQPVKIIGYAGKGPDGRDYVNIEGFTVGIPVDEIEYPKEAASQAKTNAVS